MNYSELLIHISYLSFNRDLFQREIGQDGKEEVSRKRRQRRLYGI